MRQSFTLLCLALFLFSNLKAQIAPAGGGAFEPLQREACLSQEARVEIIRTLQRQGEELRREGKLPQVDSRAVVLFDWPTRQAEGFNQPSYYGLSNFVDHDPDFTAAFGNTSELQDYNCGVRSYDIENYNHAGTDIFPWPFSWLQMGDESVEIIAAAPGTIIFKSDGNADQNCGFCMGACQWNAVYVEHADGSIAWYGHLKNGSLTDKPVGAAVSTGEYLGVMGSSGNSTGPHLHFEVWEDDSYTQLIDPYDGPCNSLNNSTWWLDQKPYREPTLNRIMTGGQEVNFGSCPNPELPFAANVFQPGDKVYFTHFYHDQEAGDMTYHKIYRPNGSLWQEWDFTSPNTYTSSWWYWFWFLPGNAEEGLWRYEVSYLGQVLNHYFFVREGCPQQMEVPGERGIPAGVYAAEQTLRSSGRVLKRQVEFGAGEEVVLEPGFWAIPGSDFWAHTGSGCVNPTSAEVEETVVSVSDLLSFQLAPNPTAGDVRLEVVLPQSAEVSIEVRELSGALRERVLPRQKLEAGLQVFPCATGSWPSGLYLVVVEIEGHRRVEKLVVAQ